MFKPIFWEFGLLVMAILSALADRQVESTVYIVGAIIVGVIIDVTKQKKEDSDE